MTKLAMQVWLAIVLVCMFVYWLGFLNFVLTVVLIACTMYLLPWLAALVFTFIYIRRR